MGILLGFFFFYSLFNFNLNLILQNYKWDTFLFLFSILSSNLLGLIALIFFQENWPFIQTTLFLILDTNISILCRLAITDRENRFVQKAFGKYVNKDLLDELVASPKQLDLAGEQKLMTVLFSDIRGFTSMSEKLPPRKLVDILNKYLDEMSQVILQNNGTIDKFIGDAVMAFWNAPIEDSRHSTNAVLTAIKMIQRLEDLKKINQDFKALNIGIGINTGEMVVGNIGSSQRYSYTILGDNVNLGSRLESLTKKYKVHILVSENTVNKYVQNGGPKIIFRLLDEIVVKGKTQPIKIYQPLFESNHNLELKSNYEFAFSLYQRGVFKDAWYKFQEISHGGDAVSHMMLERINKIQPNVAWRGVWNWDEK